MICDWRGITTWGALAQKEGYLIFKWLKGLVYHMDSDRGAVRLDTGELVHYSRKVVDVRDLNSIAVLDEVFVKLGAKKNGDHDVVQVVQVVQVVRKTQPGKGRWALGQVKWFQDSSGFGFIIPKGETSAVEVFFHYTSLNPGGFRSINDGTEVMFHVVKGPRGLVATRVYTV